MNLSTSILLSAGLWLGASCSAPEVGGSPPAQAPQEPTPVAEPEWLLIRVVTLDPPHEVAVYAIPGPSPEIRAGLILAIEEGQLTRYAVGLDLLHAEELARVMNGGEPD